MLEPGGRFVFDVFAPSPEDIEETDGLWLEREPGIFERADWDLRPARLVLSVRGGEQAATFALHWLSAPEWNALIEDAGLVAEAIYGWFDRRPYDGRRGPDLGLPTAGLTPRGPRPSGPALSPPAPSTSSPTRTTPGSTHLGVDPMHASPSTGPRASISSRRTSRSRRPVSGLAEGTAHRGVDSPTSSVASPIRTRRLRQSSSASASEPVELEQHAEPAAVAVDEARRRL